MTDYDTRALSTALLLDAMAQRIAHGGLDYEEAFRIVKSVYDRGIDDDDACLKRALATMRGDA